MILTTPFIILEGWLLTIWSAVLNCENLFRSSLPRENIIKSVGNKQTLMFLSDNETTR
jgi:hypothetical protein